MFKDFLNELITAEKLIDIASSGTAIQSSYSKWSKENDAQRAVSGNEFGDFAFHTEKEQNPWWQIEWQQPAFLQFIIINNRKSKPFDKRAAPLKVILTNENDQEICIYNGNMCFGSLPESMPLILPLNGEHFVKKIKIELQDLNCLHLCNIYCLRRKSLQEQQGKLLFFANRTDGLGERLRALLNVMYHADKYEGDWYFSWNVFNREHLAMDAAENIFSSTILEKHYLDKKYIDNTLRLIPIGKVKELTFNDLKYYDGVQVEQGIHPYTDFFNKVSFSDELEKIKKQVFDIDLPSNTAAIHLRTGDVVYAKHIRNTDLYFSKAQPFYMIESLIAKLKNEGCHVILFSLETEICRYLSEKHNVSYANDFVVGELSEIHQAFFEIFLMSRCNQIFVKYSGFAIISSLISGAKRLSYDNKLSQSELYSALEQSLEKDGLFSHPLANNDLISFNISHFLHQFFADVNPMERLRFIEKLVSLDAENELYRFMQVVAYYDAEQLSKADEILLKYLNENNQIFNVFIKEFYYRTNTTLSYYIKYFEQAAQAGSIVATLMVLMNDFYFHKKVDKAYYQAIIDKTKAENPKALGLDLLEQKLNELAPN